MPPAPKSAAAAPEPVALVKAVVARGRTITVEDKSFGPGSLVDLPAEEVTRLKALGFLVVAEGEIAPALPTGEPVNEGVTVNGVANRISVRG